MRTTFSDFSYKNEIVSDLSDQLQSTKTSQWTLWTNQNSERMHAGGANGGKTRGE